MFWKHLLPSDVDFLHNTYEIGIKLLNRLFRDFLTLDLKRKRNI